MASITKAIGDEKPPLFPEPHVMHGNARNSTRPLIGHGAYGPRRHARGIDMKRTCAARLCEAVNGYISVGVTPREKAEIKMACMWIAFQTDAWGSRTCLCHEGTCGASLLCFSCVRQHAVVTPHGKNNKRDANKAQIVLQDKMEKRC
jgi:hypothetical protein